MADIKKCDICGRTYDSQSDCFGDLQTSYITICDYGIYSGSPPERSRYDTCPCCTTRIKNYINDLVQEVENIGVPDVITIRAYPKKKSLFARLFGKCSNCP